MDNPVVVSELLKKSRELKNSTDHSAVYLKPDRTVEQRRKHRELVNELKQSIKDSPDKRHCIRNVDGRCASRISSPEMKMERAGQ